MRSIVLFLIFCLFSSCSNSGSKAQFNSTKSSIGIEDSILVDTEQESDSLYSLWCGGIDSIVELGKKSVPKEFLYLIDKGGKLNKEKIVFSTLSPTYCTINDTIFFLQHLNNFTHVVSFCFWKRADHDIYWTNQIYDYRYYGHQKKTSQNDYVILDSVRINNEPDFHFFSQKLINTCNNWDIKQLLTIQDLDGVGGDNEHILAYRILFKNNRILKAECIPVVKQGHGEEVLY